MKTILIVDDDANSRTVLRDILHTHGYAVIEAADGLQAIEHVRQKKADLLITDRSMPGLGGLELLKKLREEKISIPALMISAFGEDELWAEAIGLGASDYIVKPFTPEEVLKAIKKYLKGSK